jgi:hypothetical protein
MTVGAAQTEWRASAASGRPWQVTPRLQLWGFILADAAAIALGASVLGPWAALALHALAAFGFIAWSWNTCRELMVHAVILALAGPIAAVAWWFAAMAGKSRSLTERADWYDVISLDRGDDDDASQLHEALAAGRIVGGQRRGERSFPDVLVNGKLAEKQALLGLIGLRYHPRYHPLLQTALRSPEPSVRAQAAAVSVKLKDQFRGRLADALVGAGATEGDEAARARIADILAATTSGFIDRPQAEAALSSAVAHCEQRLAVEMSEPWFVLLIRCLAALERHGDVVARLGPLGGSVPAELRPLHEASRRAFAWARIGHPAGGVAC